MRGSEIARPHFHGSVVRRRRREAFSVHGAKRQRVDRRVVQLKSTHRDTGGNEVVFRGIIRIIQRIPQTQFHHRTAFGAGEHVFPTALFVKRQSGEVVRRIVFRQVAFLVTNHE